MQVPVLPQAIMPDLRAFLVLLSHLPSPVQGEVLQDAVAQLREYLRKEAQ